MQQSSTDETWLETEAGEVLAFTIEASGERLDKLVAKAGEQASLSRSRIKALIEAGALTLDGAPCTDASLKPKAGQAVVLVLPEPENAEPQPENIPLVVAYEDDDLIVIDKPVGLVVHPAAGHATGTLVNALLFHCGDSLSGIGGVKRPGIVHRLDKDTSGLMVVAKNDRAHQHLAAQFADHGRSGPLERAYRALVWGAPARPHGTVDANLDRSHINREKIAVVSEEKGRHAITHYAVDASYRLGGRDPIASLITCQLETGRTHQIRVHMTHIGHPLLGDEVYGAGFRTKMSLLPASVREKLEALGRQALHAATLGFEHPSTGEALLFESDLPADMAALVAAFEEASESGR